MDNAMTTDMFDSPVTAARGFTAAGVSAGIKRKGRPDVALLFSETAAAVAGVFTRNRVQGSHVPYCREVVRGGRARAIVINSGNANACCGEHGDRVVQLTAARAARALGVPVGEVLVCSTGPIGIPLNPDVLLPAVDEAARSLGPDASAAQRAIMTTDTKPKSAVRRVQIGGRTITVGGMAKGSGMIEPNMATMLAFLTTDAHVEAAALQACLTRAVDLSFNRISVDGDQSCNDTVLLLANGCAGGQVLTPAAAAEWARFEEAVCAVTLELALKIVEDGEGVTRVVTLNVQGAKDDADARRVARAIGNSLLVKTSWFGGEPNWGRVLDAAGYSGAELEPRRVDIRFDDLAAVIGGQRAADYSESALAAVLKNPRFTITVDLHLGRGTDVLYTCDCSVEYVKINSEYLT